MACGFSQKYGIDYKEPVAPVVQYVHCTSKHSTSNEHLTVHENMLIHQMDVNTAVLNGEYERKPYTCSNHVAWR